MFLFDVFILKMMDSTWVNCQLSPRRSQQLGCSLGGGSSRMSQVSSVTAPGNVVEGELSDSSCSEKKNTKSADFLGFVGKKLC